MIIFGILAGGFAGETIGQILTKIKIMSENNSSTDHGIAGGAGYSLSPDSVGAQRVGFSFNPSGDERVNSIKLKAARLINELNDYWLAAENGEAKRCFAVAMTDVESAAMWAVKGVTKK